MSLKELWASRHLHQRLAHTYSLAATQNRRLAKKRLQQIHAWHAAHGHAGPKKAITWAVQQAQAGVVEHPAGSNRGHPIEDWQRAFGPWLIGQPWCGVFVGTALQIGGVKGITSRVAAVSFIEDDARAGRGGFTKLVPVSEAQPGDAVVLFGRGVHVELVTANHGSWLATVGGNTTSGNNGDQANGGGCFVRSRSVGLVHCVARPRWS